MDENIERRVDGVCHRFSSDFHIDSEADRIIIGDRGAEHKSQVIARKLTEKQISCFVNPLDDGSYEIKITDVRY